MFLDLLQTTAGKAIAAATGIIVIGSTAYVLAPVSAPLQPQTSSVSATSVDSADAAPQVSASPTSSSSTASDVIPARFSIEIAPAKKRFLCDLTVNQQQACETRYGDGFNDIVVIGRHAGDPTRAFVIAQTTRKDGFTWVELQQGVSVGWVKLKALPAG